MDFDQSPLQPVVMDIVQHGGNTPSVHLSALVYYSETEYVEPYRVISEDRLADFTKDFSDGIVISMIIPAGSFVYKLVPNRSTLIVEVTRSVDTYMTDTSERSTETTVERFKATMVNMEDDLANQYSEHALAEFKLDMFDFRVARFQLLSEFVEKLRTVQIGTVHRYDSVADIIRTEMHKNLDKLEAKSGFEGVTMSGTPKETIDTQVIIPQGTRLVDLPKYLQESERGVYGSGMSAFYRDGQYFVWPTYDLTRFNTSESKLTIINVPQTKYPGVERTYKHDGQHLTIVTTGETASGDASDINQMTQGNASRTASAGSLHNSASFQYDKNKGIANAKDIISEIMGETRKDGIQQLQQGSRIKVTDNTLNELSRNAKNAGRAMQVIWENGYHEAIIPGMPCRLMYWDGTHVLTRDGVVIGVQSYTSPSSGNVFRGRLVTATAIYIFVSREVNA